MRKTVFGAAALAAVMLSGHASAATLLSDNFNYGSGDHLNWGGDAIFNVSSGSVDLIGQGGSFDFYPGNGQYVDLDGSSGAVGTLTSAANFGPGTYTLSFLLGGSARGDGSNTTTVSLGGFSQSITLNSSDPLALRTFTFTTATGGHLVFAESGPSDNIGNILDNVSLANSVPEPATWTLMIAGFGLAGAGLRTRRRAIAA